MEKREHDSELPPPKQGEIPEKELVCNRGSFGNAGGREPTPCSVTPILYITHIWHTDKPVMIVSASKGREPPFIPTLYTILMSTGENLLCSLKKREKNLFCRACLWREPLDGQRSSKSPKLPLNGENLLYLRYLFCKLLACYLSLTVYCESFSGHVSASSGMLSVSNSILWFFFWPCICKLSPNGWTEEWMSGCDRLSAKWIPRY
jgi:hypothetical protein